jgi:hypothetical protein
MLPRTADRSRLGKSRVGGLFLASLCAFAALACQSAGSSAKSSDATLSSLALTFGGTPLLLILAFSASTTSYAAAVSNGVASVIVAANPTNTGATVSGAGASGLNVGSTTLSLKVTAEDGSAMKTYSIAIARAASAGTAKHVYIDGGVWPSPSSYDSQVPVYWKDGIINYLPLESGYASGGIGSITVAESGDVYIAGNQNGSLNGYWKNSNFVTLPNGGYSNAFASDIAVDTAGNVWVVGSVGPSSAQIFVVWENGGYPSLLPGSPSNAWAIQADMVGNVIVIGTIGTGSGMLPCVWENGSAPIPLGLSGGNTGGYPHKLAMDSSGNLYSCGNQWGGSTAGPAVWERLDGVWQGAFAVSTSGINSAYNSNFCCMAFDSAGNADCIGLYGPSGPSASTYCTNVYYWPGLGGQPSALVANQAAILMTDSAAAFNPAGQLVVVGSVGTIEPNGRDSWPIADGIPVTFGTASSNPSSLQVDSTNPYGWARSIAIGP